MSLQFTHVIENMVAYPSLPLQEDPMPKTVTITASVSQEVKDRLKAISDEKQCDEGEIVASFVEASVEAYERRAAGVKVRLARADAGGPFIADDAMDAWLLSWGTDQDVPEPEATVRP